MADENVNINLNINADNSVKTLKQFRDELKLIQQAQADAAAKGDFGLAQKLKSQYAEMKNDMIDTRKAMKFLDPGELLGGWVKMGQGVAGAVSVMTGAMSMFGSSQKNIQEIEKQSLGIINTMMGLEKVRAQFIDKAGREEIKYIIQTTAEQYKKAAAYVVNALTMKTVNAATGEAVIATNLWNKSLNANPVVFITAGILALGAGIYYAVKAMGQQSKLQKDINEAQEKGLEASKAEVGHMEVLRKYMTDQTLTEKKRNEARKEYNELASDKNQITEKQLKNIALVNKAINSEILMIRNRAEAKVLEDKLAELYADREIQRKHLLAVIGTEYEVAAIASYKQYAKNFETQASGLSNKIIELTKGEVKAKIEVKKAEDKFVHNQQDAMLATFEEGEVLIQAGTIKSAKIRELAIEKSMATIVEKTAEDYALILAIEGGYYKASVEEQDAFLTDKERGMSKSQKESAAKNIKEISSSITTITSMLNEFSQRAAEEQVNKLSEQYDKDKKGLDKLLKDKVISQEEYDKKIEKLDADKAKKEKTLKHKSFEDERTAKIAMATIAALAAVIEAAITSSWEGMISMGVATAAEIALMASQSNPYAKGGILKGPSHAQGGIYLSNGANVEGGEAIINKRSMANPQLRGIASRINEMGGGVSFPGTTSSGNNFMTASIDPSVVDDIVSKVVNRITAIPVIVSENDITRTQRKVSVIQSRSIIG